MQIKELKAFCILSSAGKETVEVAIAFSDCETTSASVPAGISAGKYEVRKVPAMEAVKEIENLRPQLIDRSWNQDDLDNKLLEFNLAGNASLAVSAAFWKASLKTGGYEKKTEDFPKLMTLMFEGGKHGNEEISIQEFMIIEDSIKDAINDYYQLKEDLIADKILPLVGAEGAFSPPGFNNIRVLDYLKQHFGEKRLALDAAGTFSDEHPDWQYLVNNYNLASIEDPCSEERWDEWKDFYGQFGDKILVVGDDLTVTNPIRLKQALDPRVINSMIIKPNQNGTISGTLKTIEQAKNSGIKIIVSHRGEETNDNWIADLAVISGADYVKFGGISRGERIAKYNRLRELGMP